ncbi:MAG: hypothetical protein SNJ67_02970 [Chloracidobacterium sp.]|uniref:DUF8198 domain-containing protein n=1 Tax=Chloracidobacterium validum TaxID=2821543 RepID=A0ABX8B890_9BACT|nr:hypothetical protein [Chloracidobacterium validum]QUW02271.1 hypothetical protein J8C06_07840 [Chloracidobacterium validum]
MPKKASASSKINLALKRELQDFQVNQLKRNFSDLYASKDYGQLCEFFAQDIYAPRDFEERNRSFEQISSYFRNSLGERFFHGLIRLLDLYEMSDGMDNLMVITLERMGVKKGISQAQYDEAYYLCNNYDERIEQLDLIVECFHFTHSLCRYRLIGMILKTARLTSHMFSSSKDNIVDMLQRGYDALRPVKDIQPFTDTIYDRELKRLNRIYDFYSQQVASS